MEVAITSKVKHWNHQLDGTKAHHNMARF